MKINQEDWIGKMKKQFKRGIAMVELIFALVIMGIVLLSAPMLIQQSIQSSNIALQQEAIASLASHTGILLSKHWDEEDTNLSAGTAPILTLRNPILVPASPFRLRGNTFDNNISGRTSTIAGITFNTSVLGQDAGDFDDIDDYHNFPIPVMLYLAETATVGGLGDYVDLNISINTTVTYANDRPTTVAFNQTLIDAGNNIYLTDLGLNDSHIKFIQTRLTTTSRVAELDKNITLNSFSCNLGTYSLGDEHY